METGQNLIVATCPLCKKSIKLHGSVWLFLNSILENFLPKNIKEDNCPECLLEIAKGAIQLPA